MDTRSDPPRYRGYLLRFWEERSSQHDGPVVWRFSLEDPHTGERHPFANPGALIGFLRDRMQCDEAKAVNEDTTLVPVS